jgi:hypothetical protein
LPTPATAHTTAGIASACSRLSRCAFRAAALARCLSCTIATTTFTISAFTFTGLATTTGTVPAAGPLTAAGRFAHRRLRPNPLLFTQQQFIEVTKPAQELRIERRKLFGE